MRASRNAGGVLPVVLMLVLAATGCSAAATAGLQRPALANGFFLPAPLSLRAVSATQVTLPGNAYAATWPHTRVEAAGSNAVYSPQYSHTSRALSDAAYAIYAFDVGAFSGRAKLHFSFGNVGLDGAAWVGLADYNHNRWDWQKLPTAVDKQSWFLFELTGRSSGNVMPVALVYLGTAMWDLAMLSLGDAPDPGSWPMAGQNRFHTSRSADSGAKSCNILWKYITPGPGTKINDLRVGPDGTLYAGVENGLVAYDPQGTTLWECFGLSPTSAATVGPDGSIYIGGAYPNAGLHVLGSDGRRLWDYWCESDVISSPAVLPNGTICFVTGDNQLHCIYSNGNPKWQYQFTTVTSCPAVSTAGVIYLGTMSGGLSPISYLNSVSAEGKLNWSINYGCRNKAAVAPDGTVIAVDKSGSIVAVDPEGKWFEVEWERADVRYVKRHRAEDLAEKPTEGHLVKV